MDIVCNIDSNYVKYCIVTLVSLFKNNEKGSIHVHIIAENLADAEKQLMHEELDRFDNQLTFYNAGKEIIAHCPISQESQYISVATYYRIFLPAILSQSISKVLYLDCDLIVEDSIRELWDTDLTDYALAAIEDMSSGNEEYYTRLQYDKKESYFNAGVMLVNLDYWREHQVMEKCIQYIQTYPERLALNDQDTLNVVLHNQWLPLHYKWNMHYYHRKTIMSEQADKEIGRWLLTPSIIHYISCIKPWHPHCEHPLVDRWYSYLDQTRWKGERPKKTFKDLFNRYIKPIGYITGIDKPKYKKLKR